ncbi:MAG: hypothetical protein QM733_02040 [Ilumatobacteraceae bacterium]
MKRLFTIGLLGAAMTFGVAACGSDSKTPETTAKSATTVAGDTATTTGGGSSSGNTAVDDYCKQVKDFVAEVKAAGTDTGKLAALSSKAADLTAAAGKLSSSNLNADDAKKLGDCTQEATKAFSG